jgi:hypothetical protein
VTERPHPGALARNWRRILAVDASIGVAVAVVGIVVGVGVAPLLGAPVLAAGIVYVGLVVRRAREWAATRRRLGLDEG